MHKVLITILVERRRALLLATAFLCGGKNTQDLHSKCCVCNLDCVQLSRDAYRYSYNYSVVPLSGVSTTEHYFYSP
jgi:hypothetical protein